MSDAEPRLATPLEALQVLVRQEVAVHAGLVHAELFTMRGLLTLLWHRPADPATARPVAVVACGGAMGGLLGPGEGLYHQLGVALAGVGVAMLRVGYRRPNDLEACCLDVAAAVQLAVGTGAERVVVMGHSFGGAVAVRVAVILDDTVCGVATFATQSAGCEVAGGLIGRSLLLFHGERDEIVPIQASKVVRAIAGTGDLMALDDGHLLGRSGPAIWERLATWLPATLGAELAIGAYPVD